MADKIPAEIIDRLKSAKKVTALTGAGVSAESGVPTFRGEEGLWKNYRAEQLATPEAFDRNPKLVWEWYDWRRSLVADVKPNRGHEVLAEMENTFNEFTLVTQNVDGLHRLAGSTDPVEMHGNIWFTRCLGNGKISENRETPLPEIPPKCKECGVMVRPHIVWFGESLDPAVLQRSFDAAKSSDIFFVIGTSGVVQPAASLAGLAKQNGAIIIEINLERTPISHEADLTLLGPSGEVLPEIFETLST